MALRVDGLPAEVTELFPAIHDRISSAVDALGACPSVRDGLHELAVMLPDEEAMLSVPLLVHACESGDPKPAVPVASLHLLWWAAAHVFDDFIDDGRTDYSDTLRSGEALLAAVVCGSAVPTNIILGDFPAALLPDMVGEFFAIWTMSNDGQTHDIQGVPGHTGREQVLHTYRQKNGVPYGTACAMAARLAGAGHDRVKLWRRFGTTLGLVGQFRNDQEDIVSGRDEDLVNGTATYLLAHLLDHLADPREKAAVVDLLGRARESTDARAAMKDLMLRPSVLDGYFRQVEALRRDALDVLGALGSDDRYVDGLRQILQRSTAPLVGPRPVGAVS